MANKIFNKSFGVGFASGKLDNDARLNFADNTMIRQKIVTLFILFLPICFASCNRNSNDPVEILKQRIEKAEMVEYVDSIHGEKFLYPDFFSIDTTGNNVRFYYSDENVKELSLSLFYCPPRFYDDINDIVASYSSDSLFVCLKKNNIYCIMKGKYEPDSEIMYYTKIQSGFYWWIDYSLAYESQYEDAVKRLIKEVKDWRPKCYDMPPKWLNNLIYYLGI